MFQGMYESIFQEVAETIFKVQPIRAQERPKGVFSSLPQRLVHEDFSGLSSAAPAAVLRQQDAGAAGLPAGLTLDTDSPLPQPKPASPPLRPYQKESPKVGRNDPCPCGSGKKYKKCHGAMEAA